MPRLPEGMPRPLDRLVKGPYNRGWREQKDDVGPGAPVERGEADRAEVVMQGLAPFAFHRTVDTDLCVDPSHSAARKWSELGMA